MAAARARLPRTRAWPRPRRPWSPRRSAGGSPRLSRPGRSAGPRTCCRWIYLAGAVCGYRWLRRHEAVRARAGAGDDADAAWTARKAEWHRIAHLIGLGDFHLQSVTPTRLGEELLLTSAPGSELATRVAANSRPYAEKFAHLRGLPYGRVDIRTTEYPGQLVIEVREKDPSVNGPVTHPALDPDSPYTDWFPEPAQHPRPGPDRGDPGDRRADGTGPVGRGGRQGGRRLLA